ncbi:MAG: iron uptake system protein EfeO [Mycobacteriaceae bacterium]
MRRSFFTLTAVTTLPLAFVACTSKDQGASEGDITVTATDSSCELSSTSGKTGNSTFLITNNGSKVTEFYVYDTGQRVMGEVENIGPGLTRKLVVALPEAATYVTACKPGMIGDGIRVDYTVSGDSIVLDKTGKLAEAAAGYKRYVVSQIEALTEASAVFVSAIKSGDIETAKTQYPVARTYYERIEPVAESFPNDLDPRIDLREADLEPGATWTGFHRLEKDLWAQGLQADTNAIADQLLADIQELENSVEDPGFTVVPTQVAGGAQSLLDEIAISKLTGEEDIFSHTDLWDFQANVDGSQAAIASVRTIVDERNPELGKAIDRRFAELDALLAKYRLGDGFVSYDTVVQAQRQELGIAIDALSKEVSQVQGIVAGN